MRQTNSRERKALQQALTWGILELGAWLFCLPGEVRIRARMSGGVRGRRVK